MSNLSTQDETHTKSVPLLLEDEAHSIQPVDRPVIEAQDVSFFDMVKILLFKNVKSQCQRRLRAWLTKMFIPILFTLILALLRFDTIPFHLYQSQMIKTKKQKRTAFSVDNQPIDYGLYINNPSAINVSTISNQYWAPLTLCDNSTDEPAFMISIVPPYGTNPHIDKVIDKLNQSWTTSSNSPTLKGRCIDYVTTLPFEEGWIIKYFDSDNALDA